MAKLNSTVARDYHNAQLLATACKIAYLPEAGGKEEFRTLLGMDAQLVSVDNTQCYIAHNETDIVIAFRGSEQPNSLDGFKDWLLTNAKNFLTLPAGRAGTDFVAAGVGARFHSGFLAALDEIWEPMFGVVDGLKQQKDRPLWVTGHSLGGAIALLAAWRLERNFVTVHQVYTFGAPMVGNEAASEAFKKKFPNRIYRFIDTRDLVPRLPTMSLFSNEYQHCLAEVALGPESIQDAMRDVAGAAVNQVLNATMIDEIWAKLHQGVDSHLMPNYLDRISEKLG